jgi:hypothetical protein
MAYPDISRVNEVFLLDMLRVCGLSVAYEFITEREAGKRQALWFGIREIIVLLGAERR